MTTAMLVTKSRTNAVYLLFVYHEHRTRGYGDFLHYHLLASGRIDAVIESDLNILDVAALAVILREAGGRITRMDGSELGLDASDAVASNGLLHDELLDALHDH